MRVLENGVLYFFLTEEEYGKKFMKAHKAATNMLTEHFDIVYEWRRDCDFCSDTSPHGHILEGDDTPITFPVEV